MSDTEEVVLRRPGRPAVVKNTKPEIAREKLKEKRERLKKEKEQLLIEEAKKQLILETETKAKEEAEKRMADEEKKKSDPLYSLNSKLDRLVDLFSQTTLPPPPPIQKPKPVRKNAKKIVVDSEDEEQVVSIPVVKAKTKAHKEPVAPKVIAPRKPRKKQVFIEESPSNNFVGSAPQAPPQTVTIQPTTTLLSALSQRRNMNSFY